MMDFLAGLRRKIFRTWPVAAAALGGLLLLIGTSVLSTSRKAEDIVAQIEEINLKQRVVEGKLRRLRSDVHLSGIYIRDYLLDPDRAAAPEYRQHLADLRASHAATLDELRALLPKEAAPRLDNLEKGLDAYWEVFEPLFDWTVAEKIVRSARFLRREVLPRREAVLALTQEIEKLNEANLAAQREEVAKRQSAFRSDLDRRLRRALLVGFIVALVAVMRLRTLEHRSEKERRRSEDAERQMRMLSQQLVATQEEERKHLTRELHDHVGQMLTALRMEIGRAARSGGADVAPPLVEARRLVDTIVRSVRDLVMGLRPSMLDDFGLQPALEWLARDFRRRFNTPIELTLEGAIDQLPEHYRTAIYRIVQEALTNCARHAHARHIEVAARVSDDVLRLVVADDGVGIDPARPRGMGLVGIEERVRELDGSFAVGPGAEGGTELHVTIPVVGEPKEGALARATG